METERTARLQRDLLKAKESALFIELTNDDLKSFTTESSGSMDVLRDHTASIFDTQTEKGKTNVLVASVDQGSLSTSLFGTLIDALDNEFDSIYKGLILKKLAGIGLSQTLGGPASDTIQEWLGLGIDSLVGYLAESTEINPEYVQRITDPAINFAADQGSSGLEPLGEMSSESITKRYSPNDELYISREAREKLRDLAPRFNSSSTSHEALQLVFELLLLVSHSAPKALIIENPDYLDPPSLALLSMWVSYEKDCHHRKAQDNDQNPHTGLTIILCPSTALPEVSSDSSERRLEKRRALKHLRLIASRYNLVERLDTNIPVPAVPLNTFLGRNDELSLIEQQWDTLKNHQEETDVFHRWLLIKGEPGTGKTALVQEFIKGLRSDTKSTNNRSVPILRLLNQSGHTTQNTGLASLKNSLVEELRRMNLVYESNISWARRFHQKFREGTKRAVSDALSDDVDAKKDTRKRLTRLIATLSGIDGFIGVAESSKEWLQHDDHLSTTEDSLSDTEQPTGKAKQFDLLRASITELYEFAAKTLTNPDDKPEPLILVVDDLQWIDELTSEFLVKHLPDLPIFILATTRGPDSFSPISFGTSNIRTTAFKDYLLNQLDLVDTSKSEATDIIIDELPRIELVGKVELGGLDHKTLSLLIFHTYDFISCEQANEFAQCLIDHLVPYDDGLEVNTLFAIEAINIVSDPCFYDQNPDIERLIKPSGDGKSFNFEQPSSVDLKTYFKAFFEKLEAAYNNSYVKTDSHSLGNEQFNLASYAIFSERLKLIDQYFDKKSDLVRSVLFLSTMFGIHFSQSLINIIQKHFRFNGPDIQEWNPELHQLVDSITTDLTEDDQPYLFDLLERAFELIIRVAEGQDLYAFRHSLLRTFLTNQFFNYIDNLWEDSEKFKRGLSGLVNAIFEALEEEHNSRRFLSSFLPTLDEEYGKAETEEYRVKAFVTEAAWKFMRLKKLKNDDTEIYYKHSYAKQLNHLANRYYSTHKPEQALEPALESYDITKPKQKENPAYWLSLHLQNTLSIGKIYLDLGDSPAAKAVIEEGCSLATNYFLEHEPYWSLYYVFYINAFGECLIRLGEVERSEELFEQVLLTVRKHFEPCVNAWHKALVNSLKNSAYAALKRSAPDKAESFLAEAHPIADRHFLTDPETWASLLIRILKLKQRLYQLKNDFKQARKSQKDALGIIKKMKVKDPEKWTLTYADALKDLALIELKEGFNAQAIDTLEDAKSILKESIESSSRIKYSKLAFVLNYLAVAYENVGNYRECFNIWQDLYRLADRDSTLLDSEKLMFQVRSEIESGRMQRTLTNPSDGLKHLNNAHDLLSKLRSSENKLLYHAEERLLNRLEAGLLMVHSYTLLLDTEFTEAELLFDQAKTIIYEKDLSGMEPSLQTLEEELIKQK